jgi:putative FmdB family regulatory protein
VEQSGLIMPTYDYECSTCGPFARLRPMAERDEPADCPGCRQAAPRVISPGPSLCGMESTTRRLMAAQERAATGDGAYPRMRHPASCRCC